MRPSQYYLSWFLGATQPIGGNHWTSGIRKVFSASGGGWRAIKAHNMYCQAILRELPTSNGTVSVRGSLSYSPQEAWVFGGSVRANILFGEQFEEKRYWEVVEACALSHDFDQWEHGDATLVGERGVALSGGQKARVTLARACYRRAATYLLDDPLSAVDAHVGKHLFEKCIQGLLRNKVMSTPLNVHMILCCAGCSSCHASASVPERSR